MNLYNMADKIQTVMRLSYYIIPIENIKSTANIIFARTLTSEKYHAKICKYDNMLQSIGRGAKIIYFISEDNIKCETTCHITPLSSTKDHKVACF